MASCHLETILVHLSSWLVGVFDPGCPGRWNCLYIPWSRKCFTPGSPTWSQTVDRPWSSKSHLCLYLIFNFTSIAVLAQPSVLSRLSCSTVYPGNWFLVVMSFCLILNSAIVMSFSWCFSVFVFQGTQFLVHCS